MVVDEWGTWYDVEPGTRPRFLYQQNTLRDALVAGMTLNILNQHSERVRIANIAQTVNVLQAMILTQDQDMLVTPTYHVFDMYKVHHDAVSLPVSVDCVDYACGEETLPAISASASRDAEGRIHLSVCNLDPHRALDLSCEIRGAAPTEVDGQILTAEMMQVHNTFEQADAVQPCSFGGAKIEGDMLLVNLPSKSVVVLSLC
jgi:alpha-N-arabinofuranosidase